MHEELKVQDVDASDKAKLTAGVIAALGGLVAYYALPLDPAWHRYVAMFGGLAAGVLLLAWSRYGSQLKQFVLDSRIELRKIVWPTRNETGMTTLVVFVFVAVAGVFFWVLDLMLAWATRALTGQGG